MLLSNLNLLATAPDGVARLRELILTLAVQGKLLPQDPKDEPASVLLKKIRAEKDRLIADGKIKRDKPLAEIADDEKPFELPVGWEWVRLTALATFENGDRGSNYPSREKFVDEGIAFINAGHLQDERVDFSDMNYITQQNFDLLRSGKVCRNDILYCLRGSLGKFALVADDSQGAIASSLVIIRVAEPMAHTYLMKYLASPLAFSQMRRYDNGTAQPNLGAGDLAKFVFPLPPLAEQSRLVTRVEELMRLCDALQDKARLEATQHAQLVATLLGTLTAASGAGASDASAATPGEPADPLHARWQRVAPHFDLLLDRPEAVDALEQTVLQLAVRGHLVPQDPQDEPASALLKRIRAEKDQLIVERKIKRDKPLPPIAEDEQPFALPAGWSWARFPELGEFGRGKSKHRPRNDPALFNPPKYPLIQTGEVSRAKGVVQEVHSYYSDLGLAQSRMWPKGTLCITIAANIAESAILGFDSCFPDSVVGFVPANAMGNVEYFLLFVETARADLLAFAPATAQKNINLEILSSLLIPVPPLKELTRIVTRVAQLRRLCADLRQRLTASQSTQAKVAESLIASV